MTSIPPTITPSRAPDSSGKSSSLVATTFAFDVALDPTLPAPDGHFIPMASGYAQLNQEGVWVPVDPSHQPTQFQSLTVDGGVTFELRLFSDYLPDTGSPEAVMMSASPSLDSVVLDSPPPYPGPWLELTSNLWTNNHLELHTGDEESAGIGRTFEHKWVAGSEVLVSPTDTAEFLLTTRACGVFEGEMRYFMIDPELIIRGDG